MPNQFLDSELNVTECASALIERGEGERGGRKDRKRGRGRGSPEVTALIPLGYLAP